MRWVGGIVVLAMACGCQPERVEVEGHVTYRGDAVPEGAIRFFPLEGAKSTGAAALIRDGAYRIPPEEGLVCGKYRVEITAAKETGRDVVRIDIEPGESATMRESKQYLPAHYNLDSILEVELADRVNQRSFALQESVP